MVGGRLRGYGCSCTISSTRATWHLSRRSRCGVQRFSSDYDSVRAAACESVPVREIRGKEPSGCQSICGILRYMEVLLGQAIFASNIHGDYAGSKRGFTESFHNETASNVVALSDHVRDCSALAA